MQHTVGKRIGVVCMKEEEVERGGMQIKECTVLVCEEDVCGLHVEGGS